jgi:predicted ABC-type ATPase
MSDSRPTLWFVAGPNGVGKTTYAFRHIRQVSGSVRFVNLDEIARGLSPLAPEAGRTEAARIALRQISAWLPEKAVNGHPDTRAFTIETTLAGLTHLRTIHQASASGWRVALLYFAVAQVDVCLQRIARRVAEGGHDVPEADARRRFVRSLVNFPKYAAKADLWRVFDNNQPGHARIVAEGHGACGSYVGDLQGIPPVLADVIRNLPTCGPS